MRLLVDGAFPATLNRVPNASGIAVDRVGDPYSDTQLLDFASANGYAALVLLDQEMVAGAEFRYMARQRGVTLVCSVSDDPFEAEANLRQALPRLASIIASPTSGGLYWLRRDGLRRDEDAADEAPGHAP